MEDYVKNVVSLVVLLCLIIVLGSFFINPSNPVASAISSTSESMFDELKIDKARGLGGETYGGGAGRTRYES